MAPGTSILPEWPSASCYGAPDRMGDIHPADHNKKSPAHLTGELPGKVLESIGQQKMKTRATKQQEVSNGLSK